MDNDSNKFYFKTVTELHVYKLLSKMFTNGSGEIPFYDFTLCLNCLDFFSPSVICISVEIVWTDS